tara:strand:- start:683 stop:913 length:231 start_codon:yes stop_codon:yes gene_type:complete
MFWSRFFKKGYKIKMPKTTTKKTTKTATTTELTTEYVADMIERALRRGLGEQARDLETHLRDIDSRLNFLEGKGRP